MSISIENDSRLKPLRQINLRCPRCAKGPMVLDSSSGEHVCSNCGYVIKDRIEEEGAEWRNFSKEQGDQDRARTGMPSTLAMHDMGLSTVIGLENRDASGRTLQSSMKTTLERLRTWDRRTQLHESIDRNLRQAFGELERMAQKLHASDAVVEKAAYIYRKAVEKRLLRGRSISEIMAASLYAAMRDTETPRNLKDILEVSSIKRKDLTRSYRMLIREMDLKMPVADPVKSIPRIANRAGLDERTKRRAIDILKRAEEVEASAGKDPMGLAGAALYVATVMENGTKTQKDIAEAAGVTEVTIRNRYKTLKSALNF